MPHPSTGELLEARLKAGLDPLHLEIVDDSAAHRGHAGAAQGGGHFEVTVVSAAFDGLGKVERHRLVYGLLQGLLPGAIHALALRTIAPSEWKR